MQQAEALPFEFAIDDQAEAPQEDYVADQVEPRGVHEGGGYPLQPIDEVKLDHQPAAFVVVPHASEQKHRGVETDDADRREGVVIDRRICAVGQEYSRFPKGRIRQEVVLMNGHERPAVQVARTSHRLERAESNVGYRPSKIPCLLTTVGLLLQSSRTNLIDHTE